MKQYAYEFYLGIADKDTFCQADAEAVMERICGQISEAELGFSLVQQSGGFRHADGSFVLEDSLRIVFVGNDYDDYIEETVELLMEEFNQEQVLVSKKAVDVRYLEG